MQSNHGRRRLVFVSAALMTLALVNVEHSLTVSAQQVPSPWNGTYSTAQAARGEELYAQNCGACHSGDSDGQRACTRAPAGAGFAARWSGTPLGELLDYIQVQMPLLSPGGLTRHQNADILAFMLQRSGATPGDTDLWRDGPEGGSGPVRRSADHGKVATPSTKRADAFYNEEQADAWTSGVQPQLRRLSHGRPHTVDARGSGAASAEDLRRPLH